MKPYLVERIDTCAAPWTQAVVDQQGEVHPCCFTPKSIGNIQGRGLDAVWNGTIAQQLRWFIKRGLIHPVCHSVRCPFVSSPENPDQSLMRELLVATLDSVDYLARHADVSAAVVRGDFIDGQDHYRCHGWGEGRMARFDLDALERLLQPAQIPLAKNGTVSPDWPAHFDEAYYRACYPDADEVVRGGIFASGLEHFVRVGALETCMPHRISEAPQPAEWTDRHDVRALMAFTAGETRVPVPPFYLVVTMTTRCNLKCVMCPHGVSLVTDPADTPVTFLEGLKPALEVALRVELVGLGETLMAPIFRQIMAEVEFRPEAYVRSNSNGLLLNGANRALLLRSGLKELSVSCDASTDGTYSRIRGNDFGRVKRNVADFVSERNGAAETAGPDIWLNMTVMLANVKECEPLIALAAALGAVGVEFQMLAPFDDNAEWTVRREQWEFRYREQLPSRDPATTREHLKAAMSTAKRLGIKVRLKLCNAEREMYQVEGGHC